MGSTSKSAWTGFERVIAADFSAVLGRETFRVPLSGMNSRHNGGDVIIPKNSDGSLAYDILFEAKYRATHAHHTLYTTAGTDATKNGVDPKHVVLCTKVKRERNYLVTISRELFYELLGLPGALDLFRAQGHDAGTQVEDTE